jgi:hypothetical protein
MDNIKFSVVIPTQISIPYGAIKSRRHRLLKMA